MEISFVLVTSVLSLLFAVWLTKKLLSLDTGTPAMRKVSDAIKEGAEAFIRRQFRTIILIAIMVSVLIFVLYAFVRPALEQDPVGKGALALWVTLSFIFGAACSLASGYMGMWVSIRTNIRTAAQARKSMNGALQAALRGGAVSAIFVVALSLLGIGGLFVLVKGSGLVADAAQIPLLIVGYGFGASFVALFALLGGGIYTKAADVGADLVGKIESGIPEDDPRNPGVIADLVGDNVGDCAGRGADLFESTAAENIASMILGGSLWAANMQAGSEMFSATQLMGVLLLPLMVRAIGLITSIIGIMVVKTDETKDPMKALNRGYYLATGLTVVGLFFVTKAVFVTEFAPNAWWHFFLCGVIGVLTSTAFVFLTQYYTEYRHRPVQQIAQACETGPATTIITGIAVGFECVAGPILVMVFAILSSYYLGASSGLANAGLFGTALATMGMLGTVTYVLAMDTFGPITDNAGGIMEMSNQPEKMRKKTDRLDAVGNTTKALTKGYAIGSAALTVFLLFSAFLDQLRFYGIELSGINLARPEVFVGALIGAMLIFLFTALAIHAVGKTAYAVVNNVRQQFKKNPAILKGKAKPDYGQCVDIVTQAALKEMCLPGLMAVLAPIAVGLFFKWNYHFFKDMFPGYTPANGVEVLAGVLVMATIVGLIVAIFLNNSGGAWDNAKKYIEMGNLGGKGSFAHKAAVVGDTIGDPFKDTAGPAINVLIKLLCTVTLVMTALFI